MTETIYLFSNDDASSQTCSNFLRTTIFSENLLLYSKHFFRARSSSELLVQLNSYLCRVAISSELLRFWNSNFFKSVTSSKQQSEADLGLLQRSRQSALAEPLTIITKHYILDVAAILDPSLVIILEQHFFFRAKILPNSYLMRIEGFKQKFGVGTCSE